MSIIQKKKNKKADTIFMQVVISVFILAAWLCTPPGNKFLQICFWGNNTRYFIAKIFNNDETKEWLFYRNRAVYLAKMYPNRKDALRDIDKAMEKLPNYMDKELKELYRDRAEIRLFLGDYQGALSDYEHINDELNFHDYLKVAMLYNKFGNYRKALSYCNLILNQDYTAYSGYSCMSRIYVSAGKPKVALNVWALALDKKPNQARAYAEQAVVKKMMGDMTGYEESAALAKKYMPDIDINESISETILKPKKLMLNIKK